MANKQEAARAKSPTREKAQQLHTLIADRFGDKVELVDAVDPYTVITDVESFTEIMTFLKENDAMRFDFLRSVTGVDWPDDGYIESVYHLYSYDLGHGHVVKYRCPRAAPEVPTVEQLWPTANWFERETFDLLGIIYLHHSDLRRIMLPDDWIGHPLRKDYVEEEDYRGIGTTRASPLAAFAQMDEDRRKAREERGEAAPAPLQSQIKPPEGWVDPKEKKKQAAAKAAEAAKAAAAKAAEAKPDSGAADGEAEGEGGRVMTELEPLREPQREQMLLNMGPQHPSTHGVINLLVESDGEVITRVIPEVGYLHRSIEKISEKVTYNGFMPYTDRVDYVAAMTANEGYAMAIERLLGLTEEVPRRAYYCRAIASELCRIASHHVSTGTMVMDVGAFSPFLWWLRERETINDFMEELCGARLTYNYMRIGGVMADLPRGFDRRVLRWIDHFEPMIDEFNRAASKKPDLHRAPGKHRHHRSGHGDRLGPGRPQHEGLRGQLRRS